jgi:2-dehydropantoate 2-reductase
VQRVLAHAQGVAAVIVDDIQTALWQKFLIIAPWSGVGAITRAPIHTICRQPESYELLKAAMTEVDAVARARGVALPPTVVAATLARLEGMGPGLLSSMQRDLMNGRPSELEAQTGAVVRLGRAAGVATPVNELIYAGLLLQEQKARGEVQF